MSTCLDLQIKLLPDFTNSRLGTSIALETRPLPLHASVDLISLAATLAKGLDTLTRKSYILRLLKKR